MQNEGKQALETNSAMQTKPKSTSKYQKLPHRKGKYNEPYHDGLYRFQDIQLVVPKNGATDGSKASEVPNRERPRETNLDN